MENKLFSDFVGKKYDKITWIELMEVVEKIRNVTSYDRDRFSTEVLMKNSKTSIKSGSYETKEHSNIYYNKSQDRFYNRDFLNSFEITKIITLDYIKWYNINKKRN